MYSKKEHNIKKISNIQQYGEVKITLSLTNIIPLH